MGMKKYIFILSVLLMCQCKKEKYFYGPNNYSDSFENYTLLQDLLLDNDVKWSYTQLTRPNNAIVVDPNIKHQGAKSLRFYAQKSDSEGASKSSISKQKMAFWEGETVKISAWYYIEDTQKLDWIFLCDLEEQATIGAGPGMRIAMVNNQLRIEHKYNEKDVLQNAENPVNFPRNEWVHLEWEVSLSRKNKGSIKLWQNNTLIIDRKNHRTLPKDILYFQQGTKGMYSSVEFGITANSKDNNARMWVDDVQIGIVN